MSSSSNPDRRHTREQSGLVLDEEGRWFQDGAAVEHPKVARAFHRGFERDPDGRCVVRVGPDGCFVEEGSRPGERVGAIARGRAISVALNGAPAGFVSGVQRRGSFGVLLGTRLPLESI